jgi:serine/threonine-protein kinase/endoribonuclease IRE1
LVKSTAPVSRSGSSNATGPGVAGGDQDEVYIIEPSSGGDIYLYHKSTGSLQKLPLSVSQLVELSPYDDKAQDGKLFVGKKETKLVGVDLQTGKLVGVFGPEAGWCEWQSLWDQHGAAGQAGTGDVPAFSSCAGSDVDLDSIENRPRDLLYLGRTDYHISIFSKTQGLLQTLHYTSYGPSSMASSGLPSTLYGDPGHMGTAVSPDGRYIQPMHEGTLACFHDDDSDGLQWTTHLSSPIVAVFDVIHPAISTHAADSQTKTATERHLQPSLHPHPTQSAHTVLDNLSHMAPRAYVGVLDATGVAIAADDEQPLYFAMSSGHFPLISFAPAPEEDQQQPWLPRSDNIGRLGDSHSGQDKSRPRFGLLGAHIIQGPPDSGKTIDAPPDVPSIDGPPSVSRQPLHRDDPYPAPSKPKQAPPTPALPPYRDKVPSAKRTEDAALDTIVSRRRIVLKLSIESLLVLAGILAFSLFALRRQLRRRAVRGLLDAKALVRSSDKRLEPQGSSDGATPSQDAIPAARTGHRRANGHSSSASMDKALPALPVEPADVTVSTERDRHAASDGDLPAGGALPPTEEESSEKEDEGFEGSEDVKDGVKNPKKGRRRKRGKRAAAKAGTDQNEVPAASRAEEGEVPQIVVAPSAKPATVGKAPEEAGRIGSLTVSDSIIGKPHRSYFQSEQPRRAS